MSKLKIGGLFGRLRSRMSDRTSDPARDGDRPTGEPLDPDSEIERGRLLPPLETREIGAPDAELIGDDGALETQGFDGVGKHDKSLLSANFSGQAESLLRDNTCSQPVATGGANLHESGMRLRLGQILAERGIKQRELAEMLDKSNGYVSQLVSGKRQPSPELLMQLADALGISPSQLMTPNRPVAVAGRIGGGHAVELVDAYAKGDGLYHVAAPDDLPSTGIVAVEVKGDSMSPLIEEGDILFFTRHFIGIDPDVIGHVGICQTEDGRALVKQIKSGREEGHFDLFSINPNYPPEYGVRLIWAAAWRRIVRRRDVEVLPLTAGQ